MPKILCRPINFLNKVKMQIWINQFIVGVIVWTWFCPFLTYQTFKTWTKIGILLSAEVPAYPAKEYSFCSTIRVFVTFLHFLASVVLNQIKNKYYSKAKHLSCTYHPSFFALLICYFTNNMIFFGYCERHAKVQIQLVNDSHILST